MSVVVARMIPSNVRKLRSLFLCSDSTAMRAASQKEADRRSWREPDISVRKSRRPTPAFCSKMCGARGPAEIEHVQKFLTNPSEIEEYLNMPEVDHVQKLSTSRARATVVALALGAFLYGLV